MPAVKMTRHSVMQEASDGCLWWSRLKFRPLQKRLVPSESRWEATSFFLPSSLAKSARGRCCSILKQLFGSVAICNRLDTDPLNSGNSRSNLWFALQSDSDLGPDWEGQMTHVSMISKHDYKEKCGLELVAQECVLSQNTNETLLKKSSGVNWNK